NSSLKRRRGRRQVALADRRRLLGVGICQRPVREDVRRDRRVNGGGQVGIDQRHLLPVRQLFSVLGLELFLRSLALRRRFLDRHEILLYAGGGRLLCEIGAVCSAFA